MEQQALGKRIREERLKLNLTQERLAEKVGVSRQTLSSWESDITSPTLAQANVLAKVFKISLDELADNDIEMECKDRSQNQIFHNLIEQTCYLTLIDDILDIDFTSNTPVKVLSVNDDFIKVEYRKGKKISMK